VKSGDFGGSSTQDMGKSGVLVGNVRAYREEIFVFCCFSDGEVFVCSLLRVPW